jgi:4-oxalocrotonate tautomerase
MRFTTGPPYEKKNIFITLVDNAREDWSFGNGELQYAPN